MYGCSVGADLVCVACVISSLMRLLIRSRTDLLVMCLYFSENFFAFVAY